MMTTTTTHIDANRQKKTLMEVPKVQKKKRTNEGKESASKKENGYNRFISQVIYSQ